VTDNDMDKMADEFLKFFLEERVILDAYIKSEYSSDKEIIKELLYSEPVLRPEMFSYPDSSTKQLISSGINAERFSLFLSALERDLESGHFKIDGNNPFGDSECLFPNTWFVSSGFKVETMHGQGSSTNLSLATKDKA
jgi:hypothetical protein